MRRTLLLLTLLLWALPVRATITLVQHKNIDQSGSVASQALTYTSSVTSGNFLYVGVRGGGSGTLTVSDNINGSWTALTRQNVSGPATLQSFYFPNSASGSITVTVSISVNSTIRMAIYEYSGVATASPLDVENNSQNGTGTAPAASSVTPASANSLVLGAVSVNTGALCTAGTNFTLEDNVPNTTGGKLCVQDWVQTTATATTSPMTLGSSNTWEANVAVFKPSSGVAAPIRHKAVQD